MENNFQITEINVKESITFQNEGKLLMRHLQRNKTETTDNRNKVKRIILRRNFVCGTSPRRTKGVKQRNLAASMVLHSFTDTDFSQL